MLLTCDDAWFGGWRGPSILRIEAGRLSYGGPADGTETDGQLAATVFAPFTDSHVHLGLVDPGALVVGGIGRVVDLGWDPALSTSWPTRGTAADSGWPEVSTSGGLLCAPRGYPSRSGWAPAAAALEIADRDAARTTLEGLQDHGATVAKITLNSDAGPVWDDDLLVAVVDEAHRLGLPVVAHAQGLGQTRRAARAGVDALAHTPFSERLDDDLVQDIARRMTWISTLDIHGYGSGGVAFDTAVDNLTRFHAAGGSVLYGTDLGNGPLPVGLNGRELAALSRAGLDLDAILRSLTPGSAEASFDTRLVTVLPGPRPTTVAELAQAAVATLPELLAGAE
ncbi:hydrolase [Frondihabitans sucicola]|uniref:Hydrolase n=1 Tax=Frondihabitans sucicola TaxID=1268041 RepID=A0ABN6XX66_9MICO|nr:amidohydrolase [Frondihabitans sucicola]BDZ49511.1 hydrolase [Frondihabitans sucicola]